MFLMLDLFPSKVGGDTYSLGPLERANLNHWTRNVVFLSSNSLESGKGKVKSKDIPVTGRGGP
jgi:hypothetical protein